MIKELVLMEAACASIALGDIGRKREKRGEKKKKKPTQPQTIRGEKKKKRTSWLSEHGATKPLKNG